MKVKFLLLFITSAFQGNRAYVNELTFGKPLRVGMVARGTSL